MKKAVATYKFEILFFFTYFQKLFHDIDICMNTNIYVEL